MKQKHDVKEERVVKEENRLRQLIDGPYLH